MDLRKSLIHHTMVEKKIKYINEIFKEKQKYDQGVSNSLTTNL